MVISLSVVLITVALISSISPQAEEETLSPTIKPTGRVVELVISGSEFKFDPAVIEVNAGDTVRILYINDGRRKHNFVLDAFGIRTANIAPGESVVIEFVADKIGEFKFWCSLLGHRERGMEGTIIVR